MNQAHHIKTNRFREIPLFNAEKDISVPHLFSNGNKLIVIYEFKIPDLDGDGTFNEIIQQPAAAKSRCMVYEFDGFQFQFEHINKSYHDDSDARLLSFRFDIYDESPWLEEQRDFLMREFQQTPEESLSYEHYKIQYNKNVLSVCARGFDNESVRGNLDDFIKKL